jgi:hypothetical protein
MPLKVIQAPTNICNTGGVLDAPHITALSNGGHAVTYSTFTDAVSAVFDAQGQAIASSAVVQRFIEANPNIAGPSGGGCDMTVGSPAWARPSVAARVGSTSHGPPRRGFGIVVPGSGAARFKRGLICP